MFTAAQRIVNQRAVSHVSAIAHVQHLPQHHLNITSSSLSANSTSTCSVHLSNNEIELKSIEKILDFTRDITSRPVSQWLWPVSNQYNQHQPSQRILSSEQIAALWLQQSSSSPSSTHKTLIELLQQPYEPMPSMPASKGYSYRAQLQALKQAEQLQQQQQSSSSSSTTTTTATTLLSSSSSSKSRAATMVTNIKTLLPTSIALGWWPFAKSPNTNNSNVVNQNLNSEYDASVPDLASSSTNTASVAHPTSTTSLPLSSSSSSSSSSSLPTTTITTNTTDIMSTPTLSSVTLNTDSIPLTVSSNQVAAVENTTPISITPLDTVPTITTATSTTTAITDAAASEAVIAAATTTNTAAATAAATTTSTSGFWSLVWSITCAPLQALVVNCHNYFNIGYVPAVILCTVVFRVLMFPVTIKTFRNTARMSYAQAELETWRKAIRVKQMMGTMTQQDMVTFRETSGEIMRKHGVSPVAMLGALLNVPVFLAWFWALRDMATSPEFATELRDAGILWFTDLTQTDSTHALPVAAAAALWATIELGSDSGSTAQNSRPVLKWFMRASPFLVLFATWSMPSIIFIYWITSNIFSLFQGRLLRSLAVRKLFKIPEAYDPAKAAQTPASLSVMNPEFTPIGDPVKRIKDAKPIIPTVTFANKPKKK